MTHLYLIYFINKASDSVGQSVPPLLSLFGSLGPVLDNISCLFEQSVVGQHTLLGAYTRQYENNFVLF